jgi:hypothetical protein
MAMTIILDTDSVTFGAQTGASTLAPWGTMGAIREDSKGHLGVQA